METEQNGQQFKQQFSENYPDGNQAQPEKKNWRPWIIGGVVLLVAALLGGWLVRSDKIRKQGQPIGIVDEGEGESDIPNNKEGVSPISGLVCENWQRRPFAIMYSGDMDARRNFRSLSQADLVLEMPHRPMHGQPRLMGIFQCATPVAMGPMRSGRTDHISVAGSLDAVYVPWGGSSVGKNLLKNHLVEHIDCNGEVAPVGRAPACRKDASLLVSPLHSAGAAFSDLAELIKIAQANNYRMTSNFKGFHHQSELEREKRPAYGKVIVGADYPYRIEYQYDPETNSYKRFLQKKEGTELKIDIDQASKEQYAPKNIITIIAKKEAWDIAVDYKAQGVMDPWEGIDAEHRERDNGQYPNFQLGDPWFDTKFEGPASFFVDGQYIKGTWRKEKGVDKPFRFYNEKDAPIKFVPGQIWMHILGHDKHVKYQETP